MKKLEDNILEVWKRIKSEQVITFKHIEKLDKEISNTFLKVQRQRERLEKSRDYWKNKFMELKNES